MSSTSGPAAAINGTTAAAAQPTSSKVKSRGQLKRLKKKQKGQGTTQPDEDAVTLDRPLEKPPSTVSSLNSLASPEETQD